MTALKVAGLVIGSGALSVALAVLVADLVGEDAE